MSEKKIGFTIGKFAPLHKGHQYLIESGIKTMDKFIVIIYETEMIDIPITTRANWIKMLYPTVEIKYAYDPPSKYGLDEESVKIQIEYLKNILKNTRVTHFFNSEDYGKYVAKYLNVVDEKIDIQRKIMPISATKIRNNMENYKQYIENFIYEDYLKYEKGKLNG